MKTRNFAFGALIVAATLIATSCQKDGFPELTNSNTTWSKNGYSLETTAKDLKDTLFVYQGVPATFAVVSPAGTVVVADFTFGDGGATTGTTVSRPYLNRGVYQFKTSFKEVAGTITTMSGPIKVLQFGEVISDESVVSIYHAMVGGQSVDTLGLAISNIAKAASQGSYFITGDFNSWPAPATATALTKTRVIKGKAYLLWAVTHPIGLEKFNFGKMLLDKSSSWNYSPKSIYWRTTTGGGGELWVYFTSTGISNLPEGSGLPGTFGDTDPTNWVFRHSVAYGVSTASLTTIIHKTKVVSPSSPEIVYKIGENGTWVSKPLVNGTADYTVTFDTTYGKVVYFYVLAKAGDQTTKLAEGSSEYNAAASACVLQVNAPN